MLRAATLVWMLLLKLALAAGPVAAQGWQEVPRRVLVVIDSRDEETSEDNDVQQILAFPMWHLGLRVDYHDLAKGQLPADRDMAPYRGVVTWLYHLDCEPQFRRWLIRQHLAERKILMLSTVTPYEEPVETPDECDEDDEERNELLRKLGLNVASTFTAEGVEDLVRIKGAEGEWFGYERPLPGPEVPAPGYEFVRSLLPDNQSLVQVWIQRLEGSEADMVVVGPWGGFAAVEYLWTYVRGVDHPYWRIDPFRFVEAVFGLEGLPRVEANVMNGRRVFFTHVDGDAFNSFSRSRPSLICGQVILSDILKDPRYAQLPHTMSLISAEVDPTTTHVIDGVSIETAREMLALPHVEAASHAFTHPMDWRRGTLAFEDVLQDGVPYRFDRRKETVGSLERIAELAPKDRPPKVMLWSGSCNPDEETLRITREGGYSNMNGGDPRLDDLYDSLSCVPPPVWPVGDEFRFSSGAANDYLMTNEWSPPFTGFKDILETFKNTERPRPLTPVDVYYHFYIAEREISLRTLHTVLDWALEQPFARLFTSEYLAIMEDLLWVRLQRQGEAWKVLTNGKLPSVRFDGETRHVEMRGAAGVTGYAHLYGSLYVFLDDSTEHVFTLTDEPSDSLRVVEASRPLRAVRAREGERLALRTGGPGNTVVRIAGFAPGEVLAVEVETGPPASVSVVTLKADPTGTLEVDLPLGPEARLGLAPSSEVEYRTYRMKRQFHATGRFLLLGLMVALSGWILCRFHRPLAPQPLAKTSPALEEAASAKAVSLEVEGGPGRDEPPAPAGLPAGGTGAWSESLDIAMFAAEDDDEEGP